jgi:hypothetical protein
MINFCTLFDSNYLDRGLLMYDSLKKNCSDFHLYIFAFDNLSFKILKKLKLKNTTIISLKEFEDDELLSIKKTRSKVEYMWTCSSSIILYVLNNFKVSECTYVDADLYFYNDPKVLIREMGKSSIFLTKHNYTKQFDQSKISGKYCVQFMTFKNNEIGLRALNWWRGACLDWCYAKPEDGKFGDQKYLDDWKTRFKGVHVMQHLGGGVAPWNMQQYSLVSKNILVDKKTDKKFSLVFFHFHGIKFFGNLINYCSYFVPIDFKEKVLFPYLCKLIKKRAELKALNKLLFGDKIVPKTTLKGSLIKLIKMVKAEYNVIIENELVSKCQK